MVSLGSAYAKTACVLSALLVTTALMGGRAVSASNDMVVDGFPTPDACTRLGFAPVDREGDDGTRRKTFAGAPHGKPIAPPSPAPGTAAEALDSGGLAGRIVGAAPAQRQPGDIETERYPDATINPVKRVAEAPVSTFSIDVDTASYSNVRRFLNDGMLPPRDAVRVEELVNYFDYGYARPDNAEIPFRASVAVTPSPWAPGKEIMHIGLQGYDMPREEERKLNLVFLIDVSGSMDGDDRLPLAKKTLNVLIDQLRPEDRVAMAVYAGAAGAVLSPTDGRQKLKMRCALDALHAGGSTAGGEGLALAYALAEQNFDKDSVNRVILVTDGDFNVGVADPEKLEDFVAEKRKTGIYLSVYGFGRGNYNDLTMQTLSQAGNGTAAYVDSLKEARKLFRDDFSASLLPIADDVKIQIEFNPARVAEYRLIGYETRLLNREDFNNDRVDAGEVGAGASVTALYEITPVGGPVTVDPLRYQDEKKPTGKGGEIALLRIRYKLPREATSRLMERTIGDADIVGLEGAPEATRWAVAVAAYGQRLRGDPWIAQGYDWDSILTLAQGARGDDPYGLRAEFTQLVRAAPSATLVNE